MKNKLQASAIVLILASVFLVAIPIMPTSASPAEIHVPTDYSTIQAAIDAASSGDTIIVHDGTYDESLKINKSLNIVGYPGDIVIINGTHGSWDSDLKSHHPARAPGTYVYTAMDYVVGVYNGAIVNFTNIIIDGENNLLQPTTNNYSAGVAFYNAGGSFSGCTIRQTKTNPEVCDGAGISIYVDAGSYTLQVDGCEFNTWGKRAIHAYGSGITLKVDDSTFTGNGGTGPAYGLQNGIVGVGGLDMEVTDSTFEEIRATGGSYESVGILAGFAYRNYPQYYAPADDLTVRNCTFYNTGDVYVRRSMGVWITTTGTAVVEDCTFTNIDGIVSEGTNNGTLYITSQDVTIRDCDFNGPSYPASVDYWTAGVIIQRGGKADIERCTFDGFHDNDTSDGTGIAFFSWHDYSGSTGGSVWYSTFTDCVEGIYSGTTVTPLTINCNNFENNTFGIWNNDGAATIDGEYNWWGDVLGPGNETGSTGDYVYGNVDYTPWLTEPIPLSGDINEDGIVDLFDVTIAALAFGSTPSDPNWDPRADLNGDNLVDIFDMVMIGINYGKKCC